MGKLKKTALVTGGGGFIGSELAHQLIENNYQVIVYDNFSFGKKSHLPTNENLIIVDADIRDAKKIANIIEEYRPNEIYHLAALHFIPYCIKNPQETIQVNVEGTQNVLEAAKAEFVDAVVYTSTAAVYGIKETPHIETENEDPIEIYGLTKLFGEKLLKAFHKETKKKCAAARLFNGYGKRETNPHLIPDILKQLPYGNEIRLGNTAPKRDFINTIDISSALRKISSSTKYKFEIFNVGTGVQRSVIDIVNTISKILERKIIIKTEDKRKRKIERMNLVPDISKIKEIIGWEPKISFTEGFKDMLKWEGFIK